MKFQYIVEHLRDLGTEKIIPVNKNFGICWQLNRLIDYKDQLELCEIFKNSFGTEECNFRAQTAAYDLVSILSKGWKHHSGSWSCPVPFPVSPQRMWGHGTYGCHRRDLCLYLADKLESLLKETYKNVTVNS